MLSLDTLSLLLLHIYGSLALLPLVLEVEAADDGDDDDDEEHADDDD